MREEMAIEARGLVMEYPRRGGRDERGRPRRRGVVRALDGVDLRVERGEALGLVGTNGAGKTTLIKLAAGLLLPTAGSIKVCGRDSRGEGRELRRLTGLVTADERSFYWRLSPRRNLEFFAALHGMAPGPASRRIGELGELLGMQGFLDIPFSDLSSGMRQRVALARGLLHDPPVLLLDEPTHSLSPEAALDADRILRRLKEEGHKAVLLATQSPEEARRLCDRLCLMHAGRILYCGELQGLRVEAERQGIDADLPLDELFAALLEEGGG